MELERSLVLAGMNLMNKGGPLRRINDVSFVCVLFSHTINVIMFVITNNVSFCDELPLSFHYRVTPFH